MGNLTHQEHPEFKYPIQSLSVTRSTAAAAAAKSLQLCPTLCSPIDGSPPGSPIPGILQARTLEWVAVSFSNAWKWKGKVKSLSCVRLLATPWTAAHQAPPSMGFSRQEYWSGVPSPSPTTQCLLQYILFYSITVSKDLNVNYIATIYRDDLTGKQAKKTREEVKREERQMPLNPESKPKSLKCVSVASHNESDIVSTLNKD